MRWRWVLLVGLGVFVLVGLVAARPVWRKVKAVRAHRFVAEAESHFKGSNWSKGFDRTAAALQLAPTDPDVLRHAARSYAHFGREVAFRYFDALFASRAATSTDREDMAELALRVSAFTLARRQVEQLLEERDPSARSLVLGARLALMQGDLSNAVRLARSAATKDPGQITNRLAVASVLAVSEAASDQEEARRILWPVARTNGPLQVQALSALVAVRSARRSEREEVEGILAAKAPRALVEEIVLADVRAALDPSNRDKLADALLNRYSRGSTEEVTAVAAWLNRQELFHLTRGLIPEDVALGDAQLFALRYRALLGLADLRGAYALLTVARPPGHPFEIERLRCETSIRMKNRPAAEGHFRNLLEVARKEPWMLRNLAAFALREGYRNFAGDALKALASSPRDTAVALLELARIADANGETWTARDYTRKLLELRPEEEVLKLQAVYYDLLLEEDITPAAKVAEALYHAKPTDLNRRTVLALARLRQRDLPEALGLVGSDLLEWNSIPSGARTVVVAVLAAAGRTEAALRLLEGISIRRLKPEERELIKPLITGNSDVSPSVQNPGPEPGPNQPSPRP